MSELFIKLFGEMFINPGATFMFKHRRFRRGVEERTLPPCAAGAARTGPHPGSLTRRQRLAKCTTGDRPPVGPPPGEHPSNLGAYLARRIGDMVGIPAFFVDPVCVDEMTDVAHYTGFADFRRLSQFHALNHWARPAALGRPPGQPYRLPSWAAACPWRPTTTDGWWTCSTSRTRAPWAWTGPAAFR